MTSSLKIRTDLRRLCAVGLVSAFLIPGSSVEPVGAQSTRSKHTTQQTKSDTGSGQPANGAAPGQPTAPRAATVARLAALPKPLPPSLTQGIDVDVRSKAILAHLSEVIRFYRMALTPTQKIGEPSDMLYAEQAQTEATQVAQLAFQSARDEAALLARINRKPGNDEAADDTQSEAQRLNALRLNTAKRIDDLQNQDDALTKQLDTARGKQRIALQQQKENVEGQLELAEAMWDAVGKVTGISSCANEQQPAERHRPAAACGAGVGGQQGEAGAEYD